jgi:predicted aldo/keto reductase-like oxidoreductase
MYFEDYRDEKEAMRLYANLERKADACIGCSAPCTGACPHGIPIQERLLAAHELLSPPTSTRLWAPGPARG